MNSCCNCKSTDASQSSTHCTHSLYSWDSNLEDKVPHLYSLAAHNSTCLRDSHLHLPPPSNYCYRLYSHQLCSSHGRSIEYGPLLPNSCLLLHWLRYWEHWWSAHSRSQLKLIHPSHHLLLGYHWYHLLLYCCFRWSDSALGCWSLLPLLILQSKISRRSRLRFQDTWV